MKVEESPVFEQAVARAAPERVPLLAVLGRWKKPTLQVMLCAMAESSTFYFTSVFGLSYGMQTLHLSNSLMLSGVVIGNAVGIVTNPVFGALSDRIGRRPLLGASYFLAALYVLLFFPLLRPARRHWWCWPWPSPARCCNPCRWLSAAASIRSGLPIPGSGCRVCRSDVNSERSLAVASCR